MPPQSRRQKKYESELRSVQLRNRFAMSVGLLAALATAWFVWYVFLRSKPTIYISINRVSHTGAREIPFSQSSCNRVGAAFDDTIMANNTRGIDIHDIDAENSTVELPDGIGTKDTLLLFFQGHLVDAASRPSAIMSKTSTTDEEDTDVYWLAPDAGNVEKSIDVVLQKVNETKAKLKVVIFDAGRYSWSPVFPGRPENHFQSQLEQKLKKNDLNLDDNLWVIISHSDLEVSNVSTPLKSSLFSLAISRSLADLRDNPSEELNVPIWFDDLRRRTESYSRNLSGRSIQHPVLMKANEGAISFDSIEDFDSVEQYQSPLVFTFKRKVEDENAKNKSTETGPFDWSVFTKIAPQRFASTILKNENISALPYENIRALEDFLERGTESIVDSRDDDVAARQSDYVKLAGKYQPPPYRSFFNRQQLEGKRSDIDTLRRNVFEYAVWHRFRNQLRLFDEDTSARIGRKKIPGKIMSSIKISDKLLESSEAALDNNTNSVDSWSTFELKASNKELIKPILNQLSSKEPLSPTQAEMLGILSQRFIPILNETLVSDPADDTKPDSPPNDEPSEAFKLDLASDKTAKLENTQLVQIVAQSKSESAGLADLEGSETDTGLRFFLAARGSDHVPGRLANREAVVPAITWKRLDPRIKITSSAPNDSFRVPIYSNRTIGLKLNATGVDGVDLVIRQRLAADEQTLADFEFGLGSSFEKELQRHNLKDGEKPFEKDDVIEVYFRYSKPVADAIGQQLEFELAAKSWSPKTGAPTTEIKYPFSIQISEDAEPVLSVRRKLGNEAGDRSQVRLFQWGRNLDAAKWQAVELRTLPNIASGFEFQLRNNSESDQAFEVKLLRLKRLPPRTGDFKSDRADPGSANNYASWLTKRAQNSDKDVFDDKSFFELIGSANVSVPANRSLETIQFNAPVAPKKPTSEAGETAPPAANPDEPAVIDVEYPLLVVLYSKDAFLDDKQSRKPNWFQFLTFRPEEPGRQGLDIFNNLSDVYGADLERLPTALIPSVNQDIAARMTAITRETYREHQNFEDRLTLDSILLGSDQLGHDGNGEALLLVDLLGVPNYLVYTAKGDAQAPSSMDLTGIRVSNLPKEWICYPPTWSFSAERIDDPQFRWLAKNSDEAQLVFIQPKPGDRDNQPIDIEFLLPTFGEDILSSRANDFWSRWRRGEEDHRFSNNRLHQLSFGPNGLTAWSKISAHGRRSLANYANQTLEIGTAGDLNRPLGRWKFVTKSLETPPRISNVPDRVELSEGAFANTKIELDFSRIQPPVRPDDIALFWNGGKVDKKSAKDLLTDEPSPGIFNVTLSSFLNASGGKFSDIKDGVELTLRIEATDFFGVTTDDDVQFRVAKPKLPPPKPKPKFASVEVSLLDASGEPANVATFGGDQPQRAVVIDGFPLPINRTRNVKGMNVKVTRSSGSTLKITGLSPGKYTVEVIAFVTPTGQAKKERSKSTKKMTLIEGDNKSQMTLKYWDGN